LSRSIKLILMGIVVQKSLWALHKELLINGFDTLFEVLKFIRIRW